MNIPGYLSLLLLFTIAVVTSARRKAYDDDDDVKEKLKYEITEEAWFDVTIKDYDGPGEDYVDRFTIGVFGNIAPLSSMNLLSIAKGFKRPSKKGVLSYKNSPIHRIVPDFIIQMGDITVGDGTGGESIYGGTFIDENFKLSHQGVGFVSMANHGADTNGSQFFITLNKARWLDGKHVVFGKVISGINVLKMIGEVPTDPNTAVPKKKVIITDCGLNRIGKPYELSEKQLNSDGDL